MPSKSIVTPSTSYDLQHLQQYINLSFFWFKSATFLEQLAVNMTSKDIELAGDQFVRQKRLFSFLAPKTVPPLPTEDERLPYPEDNANIISAIFFWWLLPVQKVGYQRTLQAADLFALTDPMKVASMHRKFTSIITRMKEKKRFSARNRLILALCRTHARQYILSIIFMTISGAAMTLNPLLSKHLINFVERKQLGIESSAGKGAGYAIGTTVLVCISGFLQNHHFQKSMTVGAKSKSVLIKLVIEKAMKLSEKSKHEYPPGVITSMMGADLSRIDQAFGYFPLLVTFPIPVVIAIVILIVNIGIAGLIGVVLLILFLVVMTLSMKTLVKYRRKANVYTDKRVNYIQEVLANLRMIKYYSWETPYFEQIENARNIEMKNVFRMQTIRNLVMAGALSFTVITSMVAFLILYAIRGNKDSGDIFSSLSLFNVLAQQVYVLPLVLSSCADAYVSVQRVAKFLECDEIDADKMIKDADKTIEETNCKIIEESDGETKKSEETNSEKDEIDPDMAIVIKNGDFEWEKFDDEVTPVSSQDTLGTNAESDNESRRIFDGLHDVNVSIRKGEFVVLTGVVGTGKTSLLNAIAGYMKCTKGEVRCNGSLIFCNSPWIQNTTVRENILFSSDYDDKRYRKVISTCSLETDIKSFHAGDQTEIGERGITLSGGQKARINLARAVYADKDIILLDDVLSAVDAKVGKSIMNDCILGHLKHKTRVLATHQLSLIGSADKIIFFDGDGSVDVGTVLELQKRNHKFLKLMELNTFEISDDEDNKVPEHEEEEKKLDEKASESVKEGKLMIREDRAINGLQWNVYKHYILFGSGRLTMWGWIAFYLTVTTFATYCQIFANTWLTFWIDDKFKWVSTGMYIGLYVMFSILAVIFLVCELLSLVFLSNTSSWVLHIMGVRNVLRAPMSYIDTTPTGRIMNRFSRDTEVLDNEISNQLRITSFALSNIIGIVILCIIYLPWFAIAVPFMAFAFVAISSFYQASAREIKRLEALQRSYVYSAFGEILNGMETLKIYHVERVFMKKLEYLIDKLNEAYFLTITNQRWISVNLNVISTALALIISFLCVFSVFNIGAASVGLLLSYVLQIANQLNTLMRSLTQVENEMNSAERMCHYALEMEQEAPYEISDSAPPPSWPQNGEISFKNVTMAYRPELPTVLQNLTFDVAPAERIGICGRTGAGKSSIMAAMFRLCELKEGQIVIDGIDISTLGLHQLRSKLSIIPQDPVLFKGTIRRNLDPFGQSNDERMIESLKRVGLVSEEDAEKFKAGATEHKFHLDYLVEDEGVNYSLGEKQLISFARALIRDSKILILDEATSSVDYDTDKRVQASIAEDFRHCTILTIAHRLRTILSYHRILVLDKGQVVEFDTPWNLFNKEGGLFQDMCKKSQISASDFELH